MNHIIVLRRLGLAFILSVLFLQAQELPNIVIVYTDDLGYGDLSAFNSEAAYETPRLDKMAAEGIMFTDAHSASTICSPSRYSLFSGNQIYRSTGRGGGAFQGTSGPSYLKPGTLTIAQMLKTKGYETGVFGKWHVGLTWYDSNGNRPTPQTIDYDRSTPLLDGPNARGFDHSFIAPNCPTTDGLYIYIEDGMVVSPAVKQHSRDSLPNLGGKWRYDNDLGWMAEGYLFMEADIAFYQKTMEFITNHQTNSPNTPFFAVLSTQIAHAPVLPAEIYQGGASGGGPRGDFLFELDALVGRVLDGLDSLGIDDNTLVMFNSDNGPEIEHWVWMLEDYNHDATGGYRGVKRDGWEGGHRVPFIARWPKHIPAGQVSKQMTNTTDIFATVASVVGYTLDDADAVDSYDMLPAMLGTQNVNQSIRPHLLTQSFRGEFQIRQGDWKFLDHIGSGGLSPDEWDNHRLLSKYAIPETEPTATGQLFNLGTDVGETTNLFFSESAKRQELVALLDQLKTSGRSAPTGRVPIGINNIPPVPVIKANGKSEIASNIFESEKKGKLFNLHGRSLSSKQLAPGVYLNRNNYKRVYLGDY